MLFQVPKTVPTTIVIKERLIWFLQWSMSQVIANQVRNIITALFYRDLVEFLQLLRQSSSMCLRAWRGRRHAGLPGTILIQPVGRIIKTGLLGRKDKTCHLVTGAVLALNTV